MDAPVPNWPCPQCGRNVSADSTFCPFCGRRLASAHTAAVPTPAPRPAANKAASPVARVVGGLVVLGLLWFLFYKPGAPAATLVGGLDNGGWEKSWNDTTCLEYETKMTDTERYAFAKWALNFDRRGTLASAPDADPSMIARYQNAITSECNGQYTGPTYPIIAASVLVYTDDKSYEPTYR
jgi:hypothetical protein